MSAAMFAASLLYVAGRRRGDDHVINSSLITGTGRNGIKRRLFYSPCLSSASVISQRHGPPRRLYVDMESGQVMGAYAGAASILLRYSGLSLARQTPSPSWPYSSDRTPFYATVRRVDASPAWSSHSGGYGTALSEP